MSAPPVSFVARALALAAARLDAAPALARIVGGDGAAAAARVPHYGGPGGAALVERDRATLAAPRPAGWRAIHASWLDAALAAESAAVGAAVRGDADTPWTRYLARAYLGELVPMPVGRAGAASAALVALDAGALTRALGWIGRRQLAHALADSAPRSIVALAARLPWGKELMSEIAAVRTLGRGADERLGRRASAHRRTSGLTWTDPLALTRAGLRAIAPSVAALPDLAPQLAQRLPRAVGLVARVELAAFAAAPADGVADVEIAQAIARATVVAS